MAEAKKREHKYLLYELTRRCQNNCVFCYNVWKEDRHYPNEELSVSDGIAVLDKVIEETGCKHLALTGGEPLLKEGVLELASFITSKGVKPILISNGKLLDADTVDRCIECGIHFFEVSLHSDKRDIHDALVGRPGSFEEAVEAIINIRDRKGHVNTVFVATTENIHTFPGFIELNALLRVEWILFNRVACGGTCIGNWIALAPSPSVLQKALDEGARLADKYKMGMSAGVQVQPCLVDLSRYENVVSGFCPLNDPTSEDSYFVIDPGGNLRMCNRSKVILGNLLEKSFQEIIRHPEVKRFSEAVPDFCSDCGLAGECAGGCKADALSFHGTLSKPDPYLEMWKTHARKPARGGRDAEA